MIGPLKRKVKRSKGGRKTALIFKKISTILKNYPKIPKVIENFKNLSIILKVIEIP